jgi:hypothetical protein
MNFPTRVRMICPGKRILKRLYPVCCQQQLTIYADAKNPCTFHSS